MESQPKVKAQCVRLTGAAGVGSLRTASSSAVRERASASASALSFSRALICALAEQSHTQLHSRVQHQKLHNS